MYRSLFKFVLLIGSVSAAVIVAYTYRSQHSVQAQLEREKQRTAELRQIVQRITAERRVADIIVTAQQTVNGILRTTILFDEYARDGSSLPAKTFTIDGNIIHLDALVVKFDGKFVEENDPLRGHSIALFTRLYGDAQTPASAFLIDPPGQTPAVYRDPDPKVADFQTELWTHFWQLADDASYRTRAGVRIAQGEGVWRPFEPGRLYTVTLESNGGLNIRSEPLKGIFREAIRAGSASL